MAQLVKKSTCNAGEPLSILCREDRLEKGQGYPLHCSWASLVAQLIKNPPAVLDLGRIPGLGRFPAEGKGYPLQYSGLENPVDRGAWWAVVRGVAQSLT